VEGASVNKDDMILISVDDHIVEPPDMFKIQLLPMLPAVTNIPRPMSRIPVVPRVPVNPTWS
jgi:hypothetical protein